MSEDRSTLRQIAWQDVFPGGLLFSTLRLATSFKALSLAAFAIVATTAGWNICGAMFARDGSSAEAALAATRIASPEWPWEEPRPVRSPWTYLPPGDKTGPHPPVDFVLPALGAATDPDRLPAALSDAVESAGWWHWWRDTPFIVAWRRISAPFVNMFHSQLELSEFVHLLLGALWTLVVWSLFGGAICRLAAVSLARDERLNWTQTIDYARSKWPSYFAAAAFPLVGAMFAAVFLGLVGLFLRFDAGVLLAAILWPIVLLVGVLLAILLVGLFFGWPLMWATISVEGTDAFDALSRSYAYSYHRPLHYVFYAAIAAVLSVFGALLVWVFRDAILMLTDWGVSWGSGSENLVNVHDLAELGTVGGAGAGLIRFFTNVVTTLAMGFTYSFFWTAVTGIYFLLRLHVDATELDEIAVPEEDEAFGLPPLTRDAAGVAGVGDSDQAPSEPPLTNPTPSPI